MTRDQVRASLVERGRFLPASLAGEPVASPRAWLPRTAALRLVAEAAEVDVGELLGPIKTRRLFRARALFFLLARELGRPFSDTQLGRELGGRDRTTITSLARRAETMRATDPDFAADFAALLDRALVHLVRPALIGSQEKNDARH